MGKYGKIGRFFGQIWPDWGNTTWADMARLGSIEIHMIDDDLSFSFFVLLLISNQY